MPKEGNFTKQRVVKEQLCPMCRNKSMTTVELPYEIPYFGMCSILSSVCTNCNYRTSDVLNREARQPLKQKLTVESLNDLSVRVVKSSQATLKVPGIVKVESDISSPGYVTNVEGVLRKLRDVIESSKGGQEDKTLVSQANDHIKAIDKALEGKGKITLMIEDSTGNSAIISEKTEKYN